MYIKVPSAYQGANASSSCETRGEFSLSLIFGTDCDDAVLYLC